jgi:hypothetical protein
MMGRWEMALLGSGPPHAPGKKPGPRTSAGAFNIPDASWSIVRTCRIKASQFRMIGRFVHGGVTSHGLNTGYP